jgi:hypothetical protein
MIIIYILALVAALGAYFASLKLSISYRIIITVLTFLIPAGASTLWTLKVGDKAAPNSVTIHSEDVIPKPHTP